MKPITLIAIATTVALTACATKPPKDTLVDTGFGKYEMIERSPKGVGPFPLLIIAPGKSDDIRSPLYKRLSSEAVALGYKALRFNWSFRTSNISSSGDLSDEARDIENIINFYRLHPEVNGRSIVIAAKGFGARVVATGPYENAKALLLWTPTCDEQRFKKSYKKLFKWKKEMHIVVSANDPQCLVNQVYDSLNRFERPPTILTVRGDHNFDLGDENTPINLDAVMSSSRNFLSLAK